MAANFRLDLTLVTKSEDCLGESEASLGRIDGVEHLVERIVEGFVSHRPSGR